MPSLTPQLPPQLQKNDTTSDVFAELNKCPFFMTELDDQDGENEALEALKAMAYEGEPHEVAANFRNQGNERYRARDYRGAVEYYTKGLAVECGDKEVEEKLYLNRGQANLELKNYGRCISDCREALKRNATSIKAFFRMSKAFLKLRKYDEAVACSEFGLKIGGDDPALITLHADCLKQQQQEREKNEKQARVKAAFDAAVQSRGIRLVITQNLGDVRKFCLEDKEDVSSQLIFDAVVEFYGADYSCYLEKIGELTSISETVNIPIQNEVKLRDFGANYEVYMESMSGGLVKIGKKKSVHEILAVVPVIDWILKFYVVKKKQSQSFIGSWDKQKRLEERVVTEENEEN